MKYIIIFLLYIIGLSDAFSVTFPTLKKNYAIVQNIKVNKLSHTEIDKLKYLFDIVPVIVFKNQKINPEEYYNFVKIFDENYNNLTLHPWEKTSPKNVPQISIRSNTMINNMYNINNVYGGIGKDISFNYNYKWHQDLVGSSKFLPPVVSSIYTLVTPSKLNDDTIFVSYEDAYDLIEPKLKKDLLSYNTINTDSINRIIESNCDYMGLRIDKKSNYEDEVFNKQPLVIYSDKKKYRKSLLLNPNRFIKFDKLNYEDSNDLYRHIMHKYVLKEKNFIVHKWENNDLCIFNNRKLLHTSSPVVEYENKDRIFLQCFLGTNESILAVKYNKNKKTFKNKIENETIKIQKDIKRIEEETKKIEEDIIRIEKDAYKIENNTFKKYFTSSNNYSDSHDFDSFKMINYQDIIIRD
tara:strand:- start:3564 stop:4790 length:1227 start_codon:yes stop_codon:yes gene_type:complete